MQSGASFAWATSASVRDENEIIIEPGEYGWFEFAPLKKKTWGDIKRFSWLGELKEKKSVTAYSPQKIGRDLDGILYQMTSTKRP